MIGTGFQLITYFLQRPPKKIFVATLTKVVGSGRNTSLGPRFERRLLPGSDISAPCNAGSETKHVYYDGELCEAETLPNGFTKIR